MRDHLVARQEAFDATRFDDGVAAVHALHDAIDQMFLAVKEVVDDLLALGIADLLQDDLFGSLCANTAELDVFQRLLDVVADFDIGNLVLSVDQQNLVALGFQFGFGHDQPAAEGFVFTGFAINRYAHVDSSLKRFLVAEARACSRALEHDFLSTFFSRASASANINISRLIFPPALAS